MAATVNMSSILSKVEAFLKSADGQKRMYDIVDKAERNGMVLSNGTVIHSVKDAADKFIEVMKSTISSSGVSSEVASAISKLESGDMSGSNGKYTIRVSFSGDLSRPSLDTARYGSVSDLALLYNDGVGHTMKQVWGEWPGHGRAGSRTVIPGAHFMESGVSNFLSQFANEYKVKSISINK